MAVQASKDNMISYYPVLGGRLMAYSPETGEEFSANPGDYWDAPLDWVMTDAKGVPMLLGVRVTQIVDADQMADVSP